MLGIYAEVGQIITKSVDDFMKDLSQSLISGLQPVLLTALTIYFVCKAWSLMYGRGDQQGQTMKDLTMQCIKMAFVTTFFCNAPNFYEYVIDSLWRLDGFFAEMVHSSIKGTSDIKTSFDAIDSVHSDIMTKAETQASIIMEAVFNKINISRVVQGLSFAAALGISLWLLELCVTIATFIGFVVLITNTLGLAFILAFGPLFGSLLLFPQLKQMFQSWLKACLTFVLTKVFVTGGCFMMVSMAGTVFKKLGNATLNQMLLHDHDSALDIATTLVSGGFSNALEINSNLLMLGLVLFLFGLFFLKCSSMASNVIGGMEMGVGAAAKLTTPETPGLSKVAEQMTAGAPAVGGLVSKAAGALARGVGRAGRNVGRIIGALKGK
ncbi:MAG: type IV secretion system protein [Succinivibrionaceae bacterium]|nr:type IV secretion system protein [Succinivibrionaceae bacterium]